MLKIAKSSAHFANCFEGHVQQALYLCSEKPQRASGIFPALDRISVIIMLEVFLLKACLGSRE